MMNKPSRCLFVALFIGLALLPGGAAVEPAAALPPEAAEVFQWFSTLGFPDVRGCPAVHVDLGGERRYGDQEMAERFLDAFLLRHDDGGRFEVLTPDLVSLPFTTAAATPEKFPVGYRENLLAEAADAYLAELDKASTDPRDRLRQHFDQQLSERGQIFVWAWACWRNGLDERAARLYAKAAGIVLYRRDHPEPASFRERLEQDLGYAMIWRATLDFGNPAIPRPALLQSFERVARDYPRSEYADRAKETIGQLRAMIAEDAAHAAKPNPPLEELPVEARVAELIFRLRDQNGRQISQPGACDIFYRDGHEAEEARDPSPATQLVALGIAAAPQLITALDDRRFSRSVGYWRDFTFSHHVLTVGDCAEKILERIADRRLFERRTTSSYPAKDGDMAGIKAQAQAWLKEVQSKGERQTLIDTAKAGNEDGARAAGRLLERYPDAGIEPIIEGAKRARSWTRGYYVRTLGEVPGDPALAFLREEMRGGPDGDVKVYAAQAVARRGLVAEAVAAMMADWEKTRDWRKGEAVDTSNRWYDEPFPGLLRFLAGSGRVEAIQALGRGLRERPVNLRKDVVLAFDPVYARVDAGTGEGGDAVPGSGQDEKEKVEAAIEELLTTALADAQVRPGRGNSTSQLDGADQRVDDAAATVLAVRFPGKYKFDPKAPPKAREQQRIGCLNVWRVAHGEAALPPPASRRVEPAAAEIVELPLRLLASADHSEEEKRGAEAALTRLGLSALEPLEKFVASLPLSDQAGRTRLAALRKALACTVVETKVAGVPVADEAARRQIQERLAAWRGKPLTAEDFAECLAWLGGKVPKEVEGFALGAERDEDLSGVRVTLTILKSSERTRDPSYVQTKERVVLASASTYQTTGGHVREYAGRKDTYQDFSEKAAEACRAEAEQPFALEVSVWMGRP